MNWSLLKKRWNWPHKPALFRVGLVLAAMTPIPILFTLHYMSLTQQHALGHLHNGLDNPRQAALLWSAGAGSLGIIAIIMLSFGRGRWRAIAMITVWALIAFMPGPR